MILSAKVLLDMDDNPSEDEIRHAISGNLCRCTGYHFIVDSILNAAGELRGEAPRASDPAGEVRSSAPQGASA
jgi:carbon-monoxide dehydrogenase small subunit